MYYGEEFDVLTEAARIILKLLMSGDKGDENMEPVQKDGTDINNAIQNSQNTQQDQEIINWLSQWY